MRLGIKRVVGHDLTDIQGTPLDRVRGYMQQHGLSQVRLSKILRVHQSVVSRLLAGEYRPGLEVALKLQALGCVPANDWLADDLAPWRERELAEWHNKSTAA